MVGYVASINVSKGGVPKHAVPKARITRRGVEGDKQADLRVHGGPDRAVSLYSLERILAIQAEGNPIAPGSTGENLTIKGLDWSRVEPGGMLSVGTAVLKITAFAPPCTTIRGSFTRGRFTRISQKVNPGWSRVYARVVKSGVVTTGDAVYYASVTQQAE